MNFVFLMDPLDTVVMSKDTTFILMWGAQQKGHRTFYLPKGEIVRQNGTTIFHVTEVIAQKDPSTPFKILENSTLSESEIDAIFIRPDPPFDEEYLMSTWLLDLLAPHIAVINNPSAIRACNEKLWATQFASLIPRTLVGRNKSDFLEFIQQENQIVAKPTNGHGGKSVFILKKDDQNLNVTFETLTKNYTENIILQQYLPEASIGDKRILLLNGEILGAVLRVHGDSDHRNNFFSGGKAQKCDITLREQEIVNKLKPHLIKLGLYFVGIDIIGDYLVEVNVTSPTCLQEMNELNNCALETKIISFVENLVEEKKNQAKIHA